LALSQQLGFAGFVPGLQIVGVDTEAAVGVGVAGKGGLLPQGFGGLLARERESRFDAGGIEGEEHLR
jgi:hypothetical protein